MSFTWTLGTRRFRLKRLVVSIMSKGTSLLYIILPTPSTLRYYTLPSWETKGHALFLNTSIFLGEVCWVVVVAGCRRSVRAEVSGWSEVLLALSIVCPRVRLIGPDILIYYRMITVMCSSLHRCVRACMSFYGRQRLLMHHGLYVQHWFNWWDKSLSPTLHT